MRKRVVMRNAECSANSLSMENVYGLLGNDWIINIEQLFENIENIKQSGNDNVAFYNELVELKKHIHSREFRVPGKYEKSEYLWGGITYTYESAAFKNLKTELNKLIAANAPHNLNEQTDKANGFGKYLRNGYNFIKNNPGKVAGGVLFSTFGAAAALRSPKEFNAIVGSKVSSTIKNIQVKSHLQFIDVNSRSQVEAYYNHKESLPVMLQLQSQFMRKKLSVNTMGLDGEMNNIETKNKDEVKEKKDMDFKSYHGRTKKVSHNIMPFNVGNNISQEDYKKHMEYNIAAIDANEVITGLNKLRTIRALFAHGTKDVISLSYVKKDILPILKQLKPALENLHKSLTSANLDVTVKFFQKADNVVIMPTFKHFLFSNKIKHKRSMKNSIDLRVR